MTNCVALRPLSVVTYAGNGHQRAQKQRKLSKADIVLTSYPILRNDIAVLCRHHYAIAVYDEAHTFRNNDSQLYQAVQRLHTDCSIALTGTPMVNALDELWALMSILNPGLLGDYETFQDQFIHPINANLQDEHTAILRKLVAPYFLRRLRNDVLDSLPERQDEMIWCEMTDSQTAYYAEEINKMRSLLMDSENDNNQIMVLNALMRLRQLACCPKMMGIAADSGKMYEVFYRLEQLRGTDHKVLLFSEFTSFLDVIAEEMKRRGWTYDMLTGKSRNREAIVKHFQQTPSCQFFLVSLKAGAKASTLRKPTTSFSLTRGGTMRLRNRPSHGLIGQDNGDRSWSTASSPKAPWKNRYSRCRMRKMNLSRLSCSRKDNEQSLIALVTKDLRLLYK